MQEYIKWLENKIEVCLEDKDLQREHWAFCQALKKYRELALQQTAVIESVCSCSKGKGIDYDEDGKAYCIDCGNYLEQIFFTNQ